MLSLLPDDVVCELVLGQLTVEELRTVSLVSKRLCRLARDSKPTNGFLVGGLPLVPGTNCVDTDDALRRVARLRRVWPRVGLDLNLVGGRGQPCTVDQRALAPFETVSLRWCVVVGQGGGGCVGRLDAVGCDVESLEFAARAAHIHLVSTQVGAWPRLVGTQGLSVASSTTKDLPRAPPGCRLAVTGCPNVEVVDQEGCGEVFVMDCASLRTVELRRVDTVSLHNLDALGSVRLDGCGTTRAVMCRKLVRVRATAGAALVLDAVREGDRSLTLVARDVDHVSVKDHCLRSLTLAGRVSKLDLDCSVSSTDVAPQTKESLVRVRTRTPLEL
jgi:hypothetical protein